MAGSVALDRAENWAMLIVALVAVALWQQLRRDARRIPSGLYSPLLAWLRAGLYFCAGLLIGWAAGVQQSLLHSPVAGAGDLADPLWWLLTGAILAQIGFAYGWLWPRGTVTHGRAARPGLTLGFGALWGLAQGQIMLALYAGLENLLPGRWWPALACYLLLSALTGIWHSRFWDLHISPDHNVREWNLPKVAFAHTPFLIITLAHYAVYRSAAVFIASQMLALALSATAMRFPSPQDAPTPQHHGEGRSSTELRAVGQLPP